ncbi:hypothetical protein [Synechococcus sp. BO 8801]|uniref:hypothetical protein n=1 Tax=Synechococcus sp. BO 8801 TaxID=169670 RepID=UPI001303BE0F|nr:hypothetical protein [Synechococcus sp. BO 8801]
MALLERTPERIPADWKPKAQTNEQVSEGLRSAFRKAIDEGKVERLPNLNADSI